MIEGRELLQDLDQVPRSELAGSAAGGNERRQSDLAHGVSIQEIEGEMLAQEEESGKGLPEQPSGWSAGLGRPGGASPPLAVGFAYPVRLGREPTREESG
jgi:hypothetical protein